MTVPSHSGVLVAHKPTHKALNCVDIKAEALCELFIHNICMKVLPTQKCTM